jgi:tRNA-Thr(GGU) m(6)t(6)A37 methyltransferase TsaA
VNTKRKLELEDQIADLLKRWPAHSVPPAMVQELDDLEEELAKELEEIRRGENDTITFHSIGLIENEYDTPTLPETIRSAESTIRLSQDLSLGLQGLETGRQVMVIFYFHKSAGFDLLQHPRGDQSRPKQGVFTLRSPHRPNPIGVTIVDILAVEGNTLRVRGLDALNGTPVLDIKPA